MLRKLAKKRDLLSLIMVLIIFVCVTGTVTSNYLEQMAIDNTKLPEDVENSKEFQKWINNHKKRMKLEADEFRLKETNEVFNAASLKVNSIEDEKAYQEHLRKIAEYKQLPHVRFSPNEFEFLDFRHETRINNEFSPYDVYYHGLREDKIIDSKILSCAPETNCWFDRGFFIDNHTFVISEFSRNINKKDIITAPVCSLEDTCTYTIKLHVYDFINSARFVYESQPFELNLDEYSNFF